MMEPFQTLAGSVFHHKIPFLVMRLPLSRLRQLFRLPVFAVALAVFLSLPAAARAEMLQPGDFVAICGDSITAQRIYSVYMEEYLILCQPAAALQAQQFGWGGESAPSYLDRMENDVLVFHPNIVTLCYGMNDGRYTPVNPGTLDTYRTAMTSIVEELKKAGVRNIVVGTPGAVDTGSFKKLDPAVYNNTLKELGNVARDVAEKQGVGFADVHSVMIEAMAKAKAKYGDKYNVAGNDGIHPNRNGHLIMAYAFLKALGCDGDIGTITLDMKDGKAEATAGHKVLSSGKDFVEVESSRYPFCFFGDPSQQESTLGMTEFIPFNNDLNRFNLVVKNPTGKSVKVTWGQTSKTFPAEQAASGINLAAEFPDNPFSKPFAEADARIREKQTLEGVLSKDLLHSTPLWVQSFPDEKENFQKLANKIVDRAAALRKQSSQLAIPVNYKIVVESL